MKRWLGLALALAMLAGGAAAEVDQGRLTQALDCTVQLEANGVDTVIRPNNQPYIGTMEAEDCELIAYVDFVEMPNEGGTFVRLTLALMTPESLGASRMTLSVGGKAWAFDVSPATSEYDCVYYEDYAVCLSDESLPLLKALGRRDEAVQVTLEAEERALAGSIALPRADMADLYDRFVDAGGLKQPYDALRERWPVTQTK